ncbi:MAG TPA: SIS domain-containing protein [bacterium]|nr:SIS domain-containing protein [bacterium]
MSKMLNEIREQPASLARLLKSQKKNVLQIAEKIKKADPAFILLVARGSSDNAATYGKYLFEFENGIPCSLAAPSIFTIYRGKPDMSRGVAIGVSQSGEGTDINQVLSVCRDAGAYTIGITNTENSAITKVADDTIFLNAGLEKGLAATKTYTGQLVAFMMLSSAMSGNKKFADDISRIPSDMKSMLDVEDSVSELSERYRYMEHCTVIGRGFNYATAKEAALKMMETSYVTAQPFSTADFMHGPIAMTGPGFPAFVTVPSGKMEKQLHALCGELLEKQLETIIVSNRKSTLKLATKKIEIPINPGELVSPVFYIVPFQFFANALSNTRGIDPDNPRFLKKVTRTI